jgi:hypothetical protein
MLLCCGASRAGPHIRVIVMPRPIGAGLNMHARDRAAIAQRLSQHNNYLAEMDP